MNTMPRDIHAAAQPGADHELEIGISSDGDVLVVALAGSIVGKTAGDLLDRLVDLVVSGNRKLILDVSETQAMSRAGVRGIVVTSRMLEVKGGRMRICGAVGDTLAALRDHSLQHLIHIDKSRAEARRRLAPQTAAFGFGALPGCNPDITTQAGTVPRADGVFDQSRHGLETKKDDAA